MNNHLNLANIKYAQDPATIIQGNKTPPPKIPEKNTRGVRGGSALRYSPGSRLAHRRRARRMLSKLPIPLCPREHEQINKTVGSKGWKRTD